MSIVTSNTSEGKACAGMYYYVPMRLSRHTSKILLASLFATMTFVGAHIQYPGSGVATPAPGMQNTATSSADFIPLIRVVDGDTIVVRKDGKQIKVRLIGLDTPEVVDPRKPVQCFGQEASDEAHKILDGQSVRLETDPSQDLHDKYGRLLAYVYVPANTTPDGILVNKYMIEQGFGHEYTYNLPYKYQREFKAAESAARSAGRGLWAPGACGL